MLGNIYNTKQYSQNKNGFLHEMLKDVWLNIIQD